MNQHDRDLPKPLERWQHYKGGIYIIQTIALRVEDRCPVVVYASPRTSTVWVRELSEFMATLPDGGLRFERLSNGEIED